MRVVSRTSNAFHVSAHNSHSIAVVLAKASKKAEIVARVQRGESDRSVARTLGIPLSTAYYHARGCCKRHSRMEMETLRLKEQGYLVGMMVGDVSLIRHKRRGEFLAKIALDRLRDQDVFEFVSLTFGRAGKRVSVRQERGMVILRVWSESFYTFVLKYVRFKKRRSSHHHTKLLVGFKDWNREFAVGFIGGLIDSDGHIERSKRSGHYGATITTGNPCLRDQVRDLCTAHHINTSWRVDHRGNHNEKPRYAVHIPSKDLNSLCSEIPCVKHLRYHGGPGRI